MNRIACLPLLRHRSSPLTSAPENTLRLPFFSSSRISTTCTVGIGRLLTRLGISSSLKSPRPAIAKERMLGVALASSSAAPSRAHRSCANWRAS